nr:immunoglobulin heavy chain junction region [Mus musculus]NSM07635.1 immunoglobulin heavy chain junction region [Mus musculus]
CARNYVPHFDYW